MGIIIHNASTILTMDPSMNGVGVINDSSIWIEGDKITALGSGDIEGANARPIDGSGCIVMPGLVDPHTHSIWAGSRSAEFEQRLAGANYSDILEQGGGILSTVAATRAASNSMLRHLCWQRLQQLRKSGVTTVEIKSGYGLTPKDEARCLEIAGAMPNSPKVYRTFLGAHTIPKEYRSDRGAYIQNIIEAQLPLAEPHADAIDVYCDKGAFTLEESLQILNAGRAAGLHIRAHAEQCSHTGIAAAAAQLGALALDHLEHAKESDIEAMASNGTFAVFLPGAQLYLKDSAPPTDAFREAGVPFAIGTDLNPGSSPIHSLWTAATLSCLLQGLNVEEALLGITRHAAEALGRQNIGWIGEGRTADLVVLRPPPGEPPIGAALIQHLGHPHVRMVIQDGDIVYKQ
ncbi:MAG: imidazolonepropionase [Myxococcota bacterium]|nr:imidazolonepropionase [Myxococcota bacterium]